MKDKLTCKLKNHIVTGEGDFVPEGTPVTVFGWGDYEREETRGKLWCRAAAYVYCDTWESEEAEGRDRAAVGPNFFVAVDPENLVYAGYAS